jgi:hypothetical protein
MAICYRILLLPIHTTIYDIRTAQLISSGKNMNSQYSWTCRNDALCILDPPHKSIQALTKFPRKGSCYLSTNGYVMCIYCDRVYKLNLYKGLSEKPIWSYALKPPSAFSNFISDPIPNWDDSPAGAYVMAFKWSPNGSCFALSYWKGVDRELWIGGPLPPTEH